MPEISASRDPAERRVLGILLAINAIMFVVEGLAGWLADSAGLMADALDMLGDAIVYGVSIYAGTRGSLTKCRAAYGFGVLEILLGFAMLVEVGRRWLLGSAPEEWLMGGIGLLALLANLVCLVLLYRFRHGEIHLRASWLFTRNDVLANAGVIVAGALVAFSGSNLPDLVIGTIIAAIILRGGAEILRDARRGG